MKLYVDFCHIIPASSLSGNLITEFRIFSIFTRLISDIFVYRCYHSGRDIPFTFKSIESLGKKNLKRLLFLQNLFVCRRLRRGDGLYNQEFKAHLKVLFSINSDG